MQVIGGTRTVEFVTGIITLDSESMKKPLPELKWFKDTFMNGNYLSFKVGEIVDSDGIDYALESIGPVLKKFESGYLLLNQINVYPYKTLYIEHASVNPCNSDEVSLTFGVIFDDDSWELASNTYCLDRDEDCEDLKALSLWLN